MRPSYNENLVCVLEPRLKNSFDTEIKGWTFKAKEVTSTSHGRLIEGTVGSSNIGLVIYSSNCHYLVRPGDFVIIGGNRFTVDRVELHKLKLGLLNSSNYRQDYLEKISPKTIYLV